MALQFDPSSYLAAFTQGQNRDEQHRQQLAQALESIPKGIGAISEDQDKQRQDRMQQLLLGQKFAESGMDPTGAMNFLDKGPSSLTSPQPPQPSLNPQMGANLMPTMRPGQGLEASAGTSDMPQAGPTPITKSPLIDNFHKFTGTQPFDQPQQPGQTQMNPQSISSQSQPTGFNSLFQKKPFDVNGIITQLKGGDASALANLNDKQMKQLEATPAYIQMKKAEDLRTPQQVHALFPHLDVTELGKQYPNGIPKEDLGFLSSGMKIDATSGEKSNQFYQKEWDKIAKEANALTSSGRSPLGLATKADYNANRALKTLQKNVVTNQDAGNAMADLASIYQNGTATSFGMSEQAYHTLYGKIQGAIQSLTGNPKDAMPDAIKQHLIDVIDDMKSTNNDVIQQNLDYIETAQPDVISHFSNQWQGIRNKFKSGVVNSGTGGQSQPGQATHRWNPKTGQVEVIQ